MHYLSLINRLGLPLVDLMVQGWFLHQTCPLIRLLRNKLITDRQVSETDYFTNYKLLITSYEIAFALYFSSGIIKNWFK